MQCFTTCNFFQYLDRLFKKDPHLGQDFHARQVRLYAEYDRERLLPFLRSSIYYPLQGALDECQERNLIPEMVYLLGNVLEVFFLRKELLLVMFTLDVYTIIWAMTTASFLGHVCLR